MADRSGRIETPPTLQNRSWLHLHAATLALALLAAGCSQVGDYQRPGSLLPDKWQQSDATGGTLTATQIDWRNFSGIRACRC